MTGHRLCLKEALFLIILCGEVPRYARRWEDSYMWQVMALWFTLIQKMKYGDLFKSLSFPEGTCHLRISSFNIFHGLRRPGVTFGWSHLLPFPWWNYFYVKCLCILRESCTSTPRFIALTLLHFTDTAFFTNSREDPPPAKRVWLLYCSGLERKPQDRWGVPDSMV